MQYSYLIVDEDINVQETLKYLEGFPEYFCVGTASSKEEAINKILDLQPNLVFMEIAPKSKKSDLSLSVIIELHQYIDTLPYFIAISKATKLAYEAMKAGVSDFIMKPLSQFEVRKSLLRFEKTNPTASNNTICIKSYGDYQFVSLSDVVYLQADNNTTDFYLQNGRKLTAYKTLKHYEANLPFFFFRIHNSYIINSNYVSRISMGKSLCYLNNNTVSISFSKTFKESIDNIIRKIAPDNL